jgi:hypothetical protein
MRPQSVAQYNGDFSRETGWRPATTIIAGGAIMHSRHDQLMRWLWREFGVKRSGGPTDMLRPSGQYQRCRYPLERAGGRSVAYQPTCRGRYARYWALRPTGSGAPGGDAGSPMSRFTSSSS